VKTTTVKITADTNLLVRVIVEDDVKEARLAREELQRAESVALTLPALCELAWVLRSLYRLPRSGIAAAVRSLIEVENALVDRPAAEAGLAVLEAGGDFADGVIAFEGAALGADEFVSFDGRAVRLLAARGAAARRLA
jgi:predicted nucleic-acid-binding protein